MQLRRHRLDTGARIFGPAPHGEKIAGLIELG